MEYRREVDGLRALAVVAVVLFHAGFPLFPGGFVGVDIFFVISGYLITSNILSEKTAGTFSLINFYERRARRILPALFLVMFTCVPFAWLWLLPQDMANFSQSLIAVITCVSNIFFWKTTGYFETTSELKPLLHTWSLALEEQYYLFFPVFLSLVFRSGTRRMIEILALTAVVSLALAQWGSTAYPEVAFFFLPMRGWELLIGALVGVYLGHRKGFAESPIDGDLISQAGSLAGLLLVVIAIFIFDENTPFPSVYALAPTIGAALIILFATPQTIVGRLLCSGPCVGVGLVSYSAYLWHQPLFAFARHRTVDGLGTWSLAALSISSFVLAYLSWRYVEMPLRDRQRFCCKRMFLYGKICCYLFLTFGLVGHFTGGYFFRSYDEFFRRLQNAAAENGKDGKCWSLLSEDSSLSKPCLLGISQGNTAFAIVGDSHAGALVDELSRAASALHLGGYDYTHYSCLTLLGGLEKNPEREQFVCHHVRENFFEKLSSNTLPKKLILFSRWTISIERKRFDNKEGGVESGKEPLSFPSDTESLASLEAIQKSYQDSVRILLNRGIEVILVYPVPEMGWDVPARLSRIYLRKGLLEKSDGSTSYAAFQERNRKTYEALDAIGEHPNLRRIKPERIFCNSLVANRCIAHIEGAPLYFDDDHLSNAGATLLVNEIMKYVSMVSSQTQSTTQL